MLIALLVQLFVAASLRDKEDKQSARGVSQWVESLDNNPNLSFVGVVLFLAIGYYMWYAALMGNIKFGLRFFSLQFYPMMPHETFTNSFIVNAVLMNIWMVSLTYWLVDLFRGYFRGT